MLKTLAYTSRQSVYPQAVDFFELFLSVHFLFWEFLTLHLTFAVNVTLKKKKKESLKLLIYEQENQKETKQKFKLLEAARRRAQ